ncbi:MAG TPA: NADPH-dependent FMN reductase [Bryobacteraceae bacterium]|jgi:chromate reductase|nr:NADPH-dependent FMN reductase [Bryobacteraceae bacterium]
MPRILGISGSLRRGSYNTALLNAAAALVEAGTELEIASIRGVPLYDGDVEASQGLPPTVQDLKARVIACDALLLATPEYNNSIPGVFKNAIDWMSRPPADIPKVFGDRPVAVIGASAGGFGTVLAQSAWLPLMHTLRMRPWFGGRLVVPRAGQVFNDAGELVDEAVRSQLRQFLQGFAYFIQFSPRHE